MKFQVRYDRVIFDLSWDTNIDLTIKNKADVNVKLTINTVFTGVNVGTVTPFLIQVNNDLTNI